MNDLSQFMEYEPELGSNSLVPTDGATCLEEERGCERAIGLGLNPCPAAVWLVGSLSPQGPQLCNAGATFFMTGLCRDERGIGDKA